jgi:predicted ArsR family transcriptional regulator
MSRPTPDKGWTFVTNHTRLLLCLAQNPDVRLRDVAAEVGITERAAQRILADLVDTGYVERERVGRRNRYTLNRDRSLRHETQLGHEIGELLDLLAFDTPYGTRAGSSAGPAQTP